MITIAVFVGSLRAESMNRKLAGQLESLAPEDVRFAYVDVNLPLFNDDLTANYPEEVQRQKDIVFNADGVLIVTPEYNRAIPGVLKNVMDWFSRPFGTNAFDGKPLAVTGASGGPIGTAVAQADLKHIATYLNMPTMGQPELYFNFAHDKFDENGEIIEHYREQAQKFIVSFTDFIKRWQ